MEMFFFLKLKSKVGFELFRFQVNYEFCAYIKNCKPRKGNGDFSQNFTRMQIIGHKLKKQFVLFKRQGQVGQDGEWKIQPFSIPENAIREFMKLYKAKTGNEWTALPEFRRCTKKSALVPFDLMNRIQAADLEFDLETDSPSKLSPELQTIFLEFTNVSHLKEIVKKSILGLH